MNKTRRTRNRLWALALWICLGGSCGAILGYYVGRANVEAQVDSRVAQNAFRAEELLDNIVTESHTLLAEFNAAHLPACSPAEMALLRREIYKARNLRDAGRIQDGRMTCSAFFEPVQLSQAPIKPTLTSADGLSFYFRASPYSTASRPTIVLRQGDFYVVLDPSVTESLSKFQNLVEATVVDAVTGARVRPSGLALVQSAPVLDRDWQGRQGDNLYVTRCSPRTSICATAYESIWSSLQANRRRTAVDAVVGCLLGTLPIVCGALVFQLRLTTAHQLLRAIRKGQIDVVYQPIVELKAGRVVAAEALARWTDEDGNPVSPAAFVRIAEQRGFIGELLELVLRRALEDFQFALLSDREFRLNMNITGAGLEDLQFIANVEELLRASRVTADRIAFEVTEGSTARKELALATIHELRRRGHPIEIDDFGTGYSSLAYLNEFPVDAIKIDKSFTQTIGTTAMGEILPQILSMAKSLKLLVIVEGIETLGQAQYFSNYDGEIHGQGWLFGRPVSAREFRRLWLDPDRDGISSPPEEAATG